MSTRWMWICRLRLSLVVVQYERDLVTLRWLVPDSWTFPYNIDTKIDTTAFQRLYHSKYLSTNISSIVWTLWNHLSNIRSVFGPQ